MATATYGDGADIPIDASNLEFQVGARRLPEPELKIIRSTDRQELDSSKEDYWLFDIHAHDATLEFAISESPVVGGRKQPPPVLENSSFNWKNLSDSESYKFERTKKVGNRTLASHEMWADLAWNRYVAIRCPKMVNPMISVRGEGNFAALKAVGLHLHFGVDNQHEFVAVKTTNRLLPDYAKSIEGCEWFDRDGGVDVTNRTLTIYPKQLYGTSGKDSKLYTKFVTCDPKNDKGRNHFRLVRERIGAGERATALKFTWNSQRKTTIHLREPESKPVAPFVLQNRWWFDFDYASGLSRGASDTNGLKLMLTFYTSIARALAKVISGNIADAIIGLTEVPGDLQKVQDDIASRANAVGFVTAVVDAGRTVYRTHKSESMQAGGKEDTKKASERERAGDVLSAVVTTETVHDEVTAV
ncbi:hypothetical protein QBC34DRAFT_463786 [Podospora aff. communis PSN243]|uniref:Uncharacterized protein n=1 Tax=Podospora aff. communis PSN243 TaxID=3040156 RepID=A0AAV9GN23_9PEZI|nr:hypothetical protein QBC34DRAFT_463786 [Podospora aff. communis PSN243]